MNCYEIRSSYISNKTLCEINISQTFFQNVQAPNPVHFKTIVKQIRVTTDM